MTKPAVPRLHLIGPLEGVIAPEAYPSVAAQAAAGGVDAIHVRLPRAAGGDVLRLADDVVAELDEISGTMIFVNDRIDIALLVHACGVHLGEHSVSSSHARRLIGANALIGRSVHDVAGAVAAEEDGADLLIAGHVFPTGSKPGKPARGVGWIKELASATSLPIIAIGGISVDRVASVVEAGAWGVAVGREILESGDPAETARILRQKIGSE